MDSDHDERENMRTEDHIPLVIVEGFLGGAGPALWGNFEKHSNFDSKLDGECLYRRVIFASVGPVSSLHDRACELYYTLRGGTVDYGAAHADEHGHAQYGRTHTPGLYPEWSKDKPLHFLGHSLGGPTIIKLQWLISTGFFGDGYHPDMVLSVTTVSAPFRGSQAVYALGERVDKAPSVRPLSIGSMLAKFVHIASYLSPFFPTVVDLHTDARSLSCDKSSFSNFVNHMWHSDWAEGRDAAPFDVTFEASDEREARMEGAVNPGTFYRSYTACMTKKKSKDNDHHVPMVTSMFYVPLYALSASMGSFDFSVVNPTPACIKHLVSSGEDRWCTKDSDAIDAKCYQSEALWANDGVVPLFSQWHPFDCSLTRCRHYPHREQTDAQLSGTISTTPKPGVWHVYSIEDATHFSLAPFWFGTTRQQIFWRAVGAWLREIDRGVERLPSPDE